MTTTPMDFNPLPGLPFEAPRCRRYLFDRSWCEDQRAAENNPAASSRGASDPKPEGWNGPMERRR